MTINDEDVFGVCKVVFVASTTLGLVSFLFWVASVVA